VGNTDGWLDGYVPSINEEPWCPRHPCLSPCPPPAAYTSQKRVHLKGNGLPKSHFLDMASEAELAMLAGFGRDT